VAGVALAVAGTALAIGLVGTPYEHVADALLEHLHGERVACPVSFGGTAVCFVAEPARAAPLAEALDTFVADHGGALVIGAWRSGNGAHRVTLRWADDVWGGLEVWLAEQGERRVEGRLEHVVRRSD
jgi:hypothetical protein